VAPAGGLQVEGWVVQPKRFATRTASPGDGKA
jgi:hypothetical protein